MMLSNCRPETDLRNQTVGGEMGHVGKQLFFETTGMVLEQYVHTHHIYLFSQQIVSLH